MSASGGAISAARSASGQTDALGDMGRLGQGPARDPENEDVAFLFVHRQPLVPGCAQTLLGDLRPNNVGAFFGALAAVMGAPRGRCQPDRLPIGALQPLDVGHGRRDQTGPRGIRARRIGGVGGQR